MGKESRKLALARVMLTLCGTFLMMFVVASLSVAVIQKIFPYQNRTILLLSSSLQTIFLFGIPPVITYLLMNGLKGQSRECIKIFPNLKSIIYALTAFFILLPAVNQIIVYNSEMELPWSDIQKAFRAWEDAATGTTVIILNTDSISGLLSGILLIGILTGFCEELFFRGAIQGNMTKYGINHHLSIWITALIFSIFHFQFYGFFPRLILGAFFGYIFFYNGSIWLPVICHSLNNSLVVFFAWLEHRGIQSTNFENIGVSDGFPWVAISSAVCTITFLIFAKSALMSNKISKRF
ncbi:MAG: CPBP family intramembrane metalloprotease [Prevotella sp.]|nr:CPBP family intramembrane metalloprotease [Bacteroides sp.]MCM1365670.1 CPBP family intramembrane metalloprotease [Prevotella sp.]